MFIFLIKSNEGKTMGPLCLGQLLGLQHQTSNKTKKRKESCSYEDQTELTLRWGRA